MRVINDGGNVIISMDEDLAGDVLKVLELGFEVLCVASKMRGEGDGSNRNRLVATMILKLRERALSDD